MADQATVPPDQAARIAKALGREVGEASGAPARTLLVFADWSAATAALSKKGVLAFVPGAAATQIDEIVLPLDGSAAAERILPLAAQLSLSEGMDLRLVVSKSGQYAPTGTPAPRYLSVLVNTLREQHVQANGELRVEPLLNEAARLAKTCAGMVALCAGAASGLPEGRAREPLRGLPLLLYSPS